MAQILNEKERKDLEASLEELNQSKETNLRPESVYNYPERERFKTLLQDFYQERQKNMAVHREIGELTEKIRALMKKILLYFDKFYNGKNTIDEGYFENGEPDLPSRKELSFSWINENGDKVHTASKYISPSLRNILDEDFSKKPEPHERQEIEELIKNFDDIQNKLNEKIRELWRIRKGIAHELILTVPELADFKDAEFDILNAIEGLYNLDSCVKVEKKSETEGGTKEYVFFKLDDYTLVSAIKNLKEKYNFTEEELNKIKELEWSEEDKKKLKFLVEDIYEWENDEEEGLLKLEKNLLKMKGFKLNNKRINNIKREFKEGFVEMLYEAYNLPPQHKTRVLQKIMTGTFVF